MSNRKIFAFTLDLESDHSGLLKDEYQILGNPDKIEKFLDFLVLRGVKLSVFVVGEVLEKFPHIIQIFKNHDCEFHCHSYSHTPAFPDSREEIQKSKECFSRVFNRPPDGYRAPLGKISRKGITLLEEMGFKFDSSIFPSYFPNPFKYLLKPRNPYYYDNSKILEIPLTSLSPLRITFSLSYIKLLSLKSYQKILKLSRLPRVINFSSHLHVFFTNPRLINQLPFIWQKIYKRNSAKGFDYMEEILKYLKEKGYHFGYISEIYRRYKTWFNTSWFYHLNIEQIFRKKKAAEILVWNIEKNLL